MDARITEIKEKILEVSDKAEKVNMWYVVCAYRSPMSYQIYFRIAMFEERNDAEVWIGTVRQKYEELNVPYYICSNTIDYSIGNLIDKITLKEV